MSHHPERTEKNCLNCGTTVAGRYCQRCGQENVPSHMPFFALMQHFIFDIFHFDGKFFDTLRYLLFRPGFVPAEYMRGRRMSYLDPIRMYIFTSAVFFLLFFAFAKPGNLGNFTGQNELSKVERFDYASKYLAQGTTLADTALQPLRVLMDSSYIVVTDMTSGFVPYDSIYPIKWEMDGKVFAARKDSSIIRIGPGAESVSFNKGLDGRWKRYKQQFGGDTEAMVQNFVDKLLHLFPYLLFLSLPFFAGILKLLYRRNKSLFYFDHAVFTLYHYVFSFILLLIMFGVNGLEEKSDWRIFSWLFTLLSLAWPVHLLFAMKRFYGQGWGRTVAKYVVLNFLATIVVSLLALAFIIYSAFTI